jgi:hypothetical protein
MSLIGWHPSERVRFAFDYPRYHRIWRRFRRRTMLPRHAYIGNLHLAENILKASPLAAGAVVECGTWKGGMSAGLLSVARGRRDFHFFDSFEGLPPAEAIDGQRALDWQRNTNADDYHDNNRADRSAFEALVRGVARDDQRVHVRNGWFSETLKGFRPEAGIALLRLDGDWYRSTMDCLEALFDQMLPGGLIIIDDYLVWDGCTRAVHDFLSDRKAIEGVRQSRFGGVFHILKRAPEAFAGS